MEITLLQTIKYNIQQVMIGNDDTIDLLLASLLAGGHVLLEDVPGTGKTVLAKSMARSMNADFGRIQFTPDLLPSDVVGLTRLDPKTNDFVFSRGPAFCNILLADEINRATPKTQSSLLECMAEHQITVDAVTYPLQDPFFVIATQNSLESLGTFPLPEAQMDRFLMQLSMDQLDYKKELALINRFIKDEPLRKILPVCTRSDIVSMQQQCREIYVHRELLDYIIRIVHATRTHTKIASGVSPRGTLAFLRAAQGCAMVNDRSYVTPEDIKRVAVPVLAHRLTMNVSFDAGAAARQVIADILANEVVPTEDWSK